jgi:isopenicillin N synthase-like dioxygenase
MASARIIRLCSHCQTNATNGHAVNGPPVIDIGALIANGSTEEIATIVSEIAKAAKEWGFFQVVNHGVPEDIISGFDRSTKKFFLMDKSAYKDKIKRSADNSRGYFDDELTKQTPDWKECVDIGAQDGDLDGVSEIDGWNQWPEDMINPEVLPADTHGKIAFKSSMKKYFHHTTLLSKKILGALALGMGKQEDFFNHLVDGHTSYLRLNHYPPCDQPFSEQLAGDVFNTQPLHSPNPEKGEGYLSINRHTDAGVLTILRQKHDEPHSLQVFVPDLVAPGQGASNVKELAQIGDHETRSGYRIRIRLAAY